MGRFDTFDFMPCRENNYGYKNAQRQDRERSAKKKAAAKARKARRRPRAANRPAKLRA